MDVQKAEKPVRTGLYSDVTQADRAVRALMAAGFRKDQISVVCSDQHKAALLGDVKQREPAGAQAGKAAAAGGVVGAALGGLLFAATAVGTAGASLLVAGPLFMAGGAVAGSLTGAMVTRGFEREITNYYEEAVEDGKILVAVEEFGETRQSRLAEAERILGESGAEPVALPEG